MYVLAMFKQCLIYELAVQCFNKLAVMPVVLWPRSVRVANRYSCVRNPVVRYVFHVAVVTSGFY